MNKLKYIGAVMLTAMIGLCSCSSDSTSPAPKSEGLTVSLTIGNQGTTRAAEPTDLGGFAREKSIDGSKLYAVVFDTQGKFCKTYPITDYDADDGSCSFTLDAAGAYYGYIVANTSKGTELQALTAGTSTEDDFYNIVEDTDPGADLAASTNFLMISKRTLFDVDGENDTALGDISLYRAVARIDIDVTAIPGLSITEVTIENRYVKSLLVRGGSPAVLTSATDTKVYTRGTGSGEVDAIAAGPGATALVTDQQWQGVIYGYENTTSNTVVKITHTMNGIASTTTVDFADVNSGAGQVVKRNNIYTVKLTDGAADGTLNDINATVLVTDWDASTTLKYTELTDDAKPDFKVTSTHSASQYDTDGDAATKKNPGKVLARKSDTTTEITLQVTSNGKVASVVSFLDKNGSTYDFAGAGGDITQTGATTLVDGKIVQNFTISIPQTVVAAMNVNDYFTFKVNNVFNDTPTASREFVVSQRDIRMNPLWWMAETNLCYNESGLTSISNYSLSTNDENGYFFSLGNVMLTPFSSQSTGYDGWQIPSGTGKEESDRTFDGVSYHLPTQQEFLSIFPVISTGTSKTRIFPETASAVDGFTVGAIYTEPACVFGYNDETKVAHSYNSYWSSYVTGSRVRYAIRFLGTDYCSIWQYKVIDEKKLVITSKLIDPTTVDTSDELQAMLLTLPSEDWTSTDINNGELSRTMFFCGAREVSSPNGTTPLNFEKMVRYWLASEGNNHACLCVDSYDTNITNQYSCIYILSTSDWGFNVRLFRDK